MRLKRIRQCEYRVMWPQIRNNWITRRSKEWILPQSLQKENGPGRHLDFRFLNFRTMKEYNLLTKYEVICMASIGNKCIPYQGHSVLKTSGLRVID